MIRVIKVMFSFQGELHHHQLTCFSKDLGTYLKLKYDEARLMINMFLMVSKAPSLQCSDSSSMFFMLIVLLSAVTVILQSVLFIIICCKNKMLNKL